MTDLTTRDLISGFVANVAQAPFRGAPERAQELFDLFGGTAPELVIWDEEVNFWAIPETQDVRASPSGLLSLWATSRAGLLLANAGVEARKRGLSAISASDPEVVEARTLIEHVRALIRDRDAPWPRSLPHPIPEAVQGTREAAFNNVFLLATAFALLHEIGHLQKKHERITSSDIRVRQENEADAWAADWLLAAAPADQREARVFAIACGIGWLGLIDQIRRGSTTHPHGSERLERVSRAFQVPPTSAGLEMATYAIKALFDPDTPVPMFDEVEDAFLHTAMAWSRLPR